MEVMERIKKTVDENPIVLFMKGSPDSPSCGFSARTVEVLKACSVEFNFVNVLEDPEIFQNLPQFADWPTFPQLYIKGELVGGCDITLELYQQGDLQKMVDDAVKS